MGNSESSSQLPPPPPRSDDGNNNRSARVEEEESNTSSASAILKVGAAVAGTALVALGAAAYTLASSSSSQSDDRDGGKREAHMEALEARGFNSDVDLNNYVYHQSPNPRSLKHLGDSGQYSELRMIQIMSYNVWFREDVAVEERMNAIGDLIEEHNPDIIFFQEVTPYIYELFQDSNWWRNYQCSVPPQIAKTRTYFCMLLSKLPVKQFTCAPFKNSKMGRELCIAEVDAGTNKKLVVAASHLESPTPPMMNSEERVAQAKEALEILQSSAANVIYGGDMNWDEISDGSFPLLGGWYDAWSVQNLGEDGWTYDTKRNAMLKGYRPLRKRLDRFVCKLKDYKVVSVHMIGTDAIPGIYYYHKGRELPVLPSDHYGLILAICPM